MHACLALGVGAGVAVADTCSQDSVALRGEWGQARFSVEVAETEAERARGLMHRESMASSAGMLFVYPTSGPVSFWMRNTLIPLDLIFLDETGVVGHVHHNAIPLDETPIPGGRNVQYVLEINGGLAAAIGISEGSELQHPQVSQEIAKWPC